MGTFARCYTFAWMRLTFAMQYFLREQVMLETNDDDWVERCTNEECSSRIPHATIKEGQVWTSQPCARGARPAERARGRPAEKRRLVRTAQKRV